MYFTDIQAFVSTGQIQLKTSLFFKLFKGLPARRYFKYLHVKLMDFCICMGLGTKTQYVINA